MWLYTAFSGIFIGKDEFGNKYYQSKKVDSESGKKKRWVIYNGEPEPSKVPAQWFGWLHYQTDIQPMAKQRRLDWEKPHLPNLTGTKNAYFPPNSTVAGGQKIKKSGNYEAWKPSE